jgi:hypothetical protein
MNTKSIGEKSEGVVLAKFLQLGWIVLLPFGDNQRYDFVIDRGNGFEKIQVKTARLKEGWVEFTPYSSRSHRGQSNKSYRGECDYFASFCPKNGKIYFLKVDDCCEASVKLRITPPKNNQKSKIRYAMDFEI